MKKKLVISTFVALVFSSLAFSQSETTYTIDNTKSTFTWVGKKPTGEHTGTVKFSSGNAIFNKNNLTAGTIEMDMSSIECTDLTGEYKDKLVGHLKSEDFFSTDKFKTATLKITKAVFLKDSKTKNNYEITADLTIKGISHSITFAAMVFINENGEMITNAEFDIDRTLYDIKFMSLKFFSEIGDKFIEDKFNVRIRLVGAKK